MVVWYGIYILYIYTGINIGQDTGINEVYIQYIYIVPIVQISIGTIDTNTRFLIKN
jgi:hypothetical protein